MENKFRIALLSMAAVGLVGCTDKLSDDITQSKDGVTDGFVTFKISSVDSQTRAAGSYGEGDDLDDSFNKGHADESAITTEQGANVVFLFDSQNKYKGRSELQIMATNDQSYDNEHPGTLDENYKKEEGYFNARIKKSKSEEDLQCVMILNAPPAELNALELTEGTTTLAEFLEMTEDFKDGLSLGLYTDSNKDTYFTMSNTVYVSGVETPEEIEGPISITDENIFSTSQDAQANPVVVHVERMAAKYELKYNNASLNTNIISMTNTNDENPNYLYVRTSADLTKSEDIQPQSWAIKIVGWDVNGTEKKEFWVKNLITDAANNTPVYDASTGNIGNWNYAYTYQSTNGWNDPSRIRSYWAVDPHYNGTSDRYPEQYRNVTGEGDIKTGVSTDNALNYIAYEKITPLSTSSTGSADNVNILTTYRYSPENTFGEYTFMDESSESDYSYKVGDVNRNYKRASTHLLLAAELLIGEEINGTEDLADKYCYENIFWFGNNINELIKYMMRDVLAEYKGTLYKDNNGSTAFSADDAADYFDLKEGATIKGGDGRVMLTLKTDKTLYKQKAEGGYEALKDTDSDWQDVIFTTGTAKHFKEGKMYYPIYIRHMAPIKVDNEGETHYNIGSYGVVRNHWYTINITDIQVPGIPVDDPEQPIIPNDDPDEGGYIAFEIVIVPWHVINQSVEFK